MDVEELTDESGCLGEWVGRQLRGWSWNVQGKNITQVEQFVDGLSLYHEWDICAVQEVDASLLDFHDHDGESCADSLSTPDGHAMFS